MRNEAEVCTIIKHSMPSCFKIPDPNTMYTQSSMRVFDGIGLLPYSVFNESEDKMHFVCWEAKYLNSMQAFPMKKIEPHQSYYLTEYMKCTDVRSLLIVGIDVKRGDQRIYVFEWSKFMEDLYSIGFSFHKQYMESLPYNSIHKGVFKFNNIITETTIKNLYADKFNAVYNKFKEKSNDTSKV